MKTSVQKPTPEERLAQMTPQQRIDLFTRSLSKPGIPENLKAQYQNLIAAEEKKIAASLKVAAVTVVEAHASAAVSKAITSKKLYEMTSQEIVSACNKMIAEHRDAALVVTKTKAAAATNSIAKAHKALLAAHKAQQALPADASEEVKSQTVMAFTKARQDYDKAQETEVTRKEAGSKFQVISRTTANFITEAVSEMLYGKNADHDLYVDLQAWLVNNQKDVFVPEGLTRLKGNEGVKIFIDAHGNIIANNFVGNFFSFDSTGQTLTFRNTGGSISLGQVISIGGVSVTFDKPSAGIGVKDGEISIIVNDLKITKIEGKCQVCLVGNDPHGRISVSQTGSVEINQYIDPDTILEATPAASAASSDSSDVAESGSASSKVAGPDIAEQELSSSSSSSSVPVTTSPASVALSSPEDNAIAESKVTFMSKISHYIAILTKASQSHDDSVAASSASEEDISQAADSLLDFTRDNTYLDNKDYSELIGQAQSVLSHLHD